MKRRQSEIRKREPENIRTKIDAILHSKELSDVDKRDQLRLLIPADVLKIDYLSQASPTQLRKLQDATEVAQAIQRLNAESYLEGQ